MKYDLLFSDIVAWIAGLFGLLAGVITLQKAMLHWSAGSLSIGLSMSLVGVFLLLQARKFIFAKSYNQMMSRSVRWLPRVLFVTLCLFWMVWVAAMILGAEPHDVLGLPAYAPWLFSPVLLAVLGLCFCLVFIAPGLAFRPYKAQMTAPAPRTSPGKLRVFVRWLFGDNTIPLRPHPTAATVGKVANAFLGICLLCGIFVYTTSKTTASLSYLEMAKPALYLLTLVIFICLYLPRNYGTRIFADTGEVSSSSARKMKNAMLVMGMSFGLAHLPYVYMVPWAYNSFIATEKAEIGYEVKNKVSSGLCRSGLGLAYPQDPSRNFHVCNLSGTLVHRVNAGDTVFVYGPISEVGHTAERVRYALQSSDL